MLFMHNNFTFNWFTYFVAVNYTIVVTNVSNVIYNFERNGLSKVIYSEKVINLFQR